MNLIFMRKRKNAGHSLSMMVGKGRRLNCSFYISPTTHNFRQIVGPGKDEKITICILWYDVKVIIMLSELCILILWGREDLTWFSHHRIIIKSTFCSSDPAASIQHTLSNCKRVDFPSIQQNVLPGRVSCVPNYHKVGDDTAAAVPWFPRTIIAALHFFATVGLHQGWALNSFPGNGKIMWKHVSTTVDTARVNLSQVYKIVTASVNTMSIEQAQLWTTTVKIEQRGLLIGSCWIE